MIQKLLAGSTALLLLAMPVPAAAAVTLSCPVIISHKGGGSVTPENTLPAIRAGADVQHATVAEIDIRFNKSNFAFALHDSDLAIRSNGTGQVTDKWFGEMNALSYVDYAPWNTNPSYAGFLPGGAPRTKVPYSYEFLLTAHQEGLQLLLDVKVTPTKEQADSLIGDYMSRPDLAMRDRVFWMANSPAGLTAVRGWYPDLEYWLLEMPPAGYVGRTGESLLALGATTYALPYQSITPAAVAYYHSYGLKVADWATSWAGADVAATWAAMRTAGVDYLITDNGAAAGAAQAADCGGA